MADIPKLTQEDIQSLIQLYGGGFNAQQLGLQVGLPISQLVPAYMGMVPGETDANLINAQDPIRDKLIASGWLSQASDTQGNTRWGPGAEWEALNPRTGTLDKPGASTVNFGVVPGGNIFNSNPGGPPDAAKVWWDKAPTYGAADPLTGIAQMLTPGKVGYDMGNWWNRAGPYIGPAIGAAMTAGLGAGGIGIGSAMGGGLGGSIGSSLFNIAGNTMMGNQSNPMSILAGLLGKAGPGVLEKLMSTMNG